ncbi:MAG: glycosyltransferase [Planctomycetota bacterium]|nr:glycosyltransferase [Planctomycetota bacterium]
MRVAAATPASSVAPEEGWGSLTAPVSVVILTLNEEVNIADCLRSCAWCDDVHVVDSGSTDRTVEIARAMGAKVYHNPFESFGKQRNWAIEHCPCTHEWIFHLDADERFTPALVGAMRELLAREPATAGYHIPQKFMFMGKWLKRAAVYPTYQMRLFHKTRMRFCDWGHGQREMTEGEVGVLNVPYLHYGLSKGLSEWIDRHNRYSTAEAIEAAKLLGEKANWRDVFSKDPIRRRRAYKEVSYRLPFRASIRHIVTLWVLGAAFEGKPGRTYAQLLNLYERMITLKLRLIREKAARHRATESPDFERDTLPRVRTAAPPPDDGLTSHRRERPGGTSVAIPQNGDAAGASFGLTPRAPDARPGADADIVVEVTTPTGDIVQLFPESTPWTFKQKVFRAIWMLVGKPLFRMSFHNWYGVRAAILRLFGARVGAGVRIRPTVNIEVPWNLHIHDGVTVGDYAILYSLGVIEIGERTIVSQYAHLCAGTHDYTDRRFPLIRDPIIIGADAWIGADAFVGPNVKIGRLSVLGARSSAYKDLQPGMVYAGNPARPLKKRELH